MEKPRGWFSPGTFIVQFTLMLVVRVLLGVLVWHHGPKLEDLANALLYALAMASLPVQWAIYRLSQVSEKRSPNRP